MRIYWINVLFIPTVYGYTTVHRSQIGRRPLFYFPPNCFLFNDHQNHLKVRRCAPRPRKASRLLSVRKEDEAVQNQPLDLDKILSQLEAFKALSLPYFYEAKSGRWLFAGLIALTLMNSGVSVAFSYVGKDFWNALSSKDPDQFYDMLTKFAAALFVGSPVSVLYRFQREQLAVSWRKWMTDRVLQLYSANRVYYSLEQSDLIDNPDQRLTEDIRSFTAFSLQLFITILTSLIDLVSFSFILYSIQPQLFSAIILYAIFGTVTTTALGGNLVQLNYDKLQKEADFRYSLVRFRENAENIAFYSGEDIEGKEVSKRLERVVQNRQNINRSQRNLEFFTTSYNYFVQILPVWVVAPQYFSGAVQLGVVSQSAGAFNHILSDLSVIVNQFEQLSSFSAAIDRLTSFMTAVRDVDETRNESDGLLQLNSTSKMSPEWSNTSSTLSIINPERITVYQRDYITDTETMSEGILSVQNLTLCTPDRKRTIIEGLSFSVKEGENMLIVGNSGSGKSSLLRAIAGLWTAGSGSIIRPSDKDVYFLPQRPYCALGSLKDQLLYPSLDEMNPQNYPEGHRLSRLHFLRQSYTDDDLLRIFELVDLPQLPTRFGDGDPYKGLYAVMDWSNILSLGEQQRLAFGRLMVNRPRFVILDEATSALDIQAEAKMYRLLQQLKPDQVDANFSGVTFLSVGHRPTLLAYHDTKLNLNGGRNNNITSIDFDSSSSSTVIKMTF